MLPELLQKYTSITVLPITDQQRVLANHIYVLPPGKKVAIKGGGLELLDQSATTHIRLPIDFFLSSLAQDKREHVICVILSGMGQDGTLGLKNLREQGGLVIAQTLKSALYEGMPKSAINTGLVDYILPPEDMYGFIIKYMAHFKDKSIFIEQNISAELQQILAFVKSHTGHDFSLYKTNTIFRRIHKRLDVLQINTLSDYVYYLHQNPTEITLLFKELLINVTSFFRDRDAFDRLNKELIECVLVHKESSDTLRVWVPGCSTGEEVYTIAMIISESMSFLNLYCHVQIFGTDIDEEAIEIARAGIFPKSIQHEVTPERLDRFFTIEHGSYKIIPDIRKMIIFAVQNVIKDPPFTKLDLLSCRNLLIYLSAPLQKRVLPLFHYSLCPNGLLFLGTSETISGSSDFFNIIDKKWKIFQRNEVQSTFKSTRYLASDVKGTELISNKITESTMPEIEPNLHQLITNILRGIFEEMKSPPINQESTGKVRKHKKVAELEQELNYTKESLQTTIEELETSNEELKSSNEELQSANEELQSTNEEIETSKEELQSLNEELSTVNTELEHRIDQLSSTNDDIKNLLDNTEIATIFLDKNLCIKRFTPKATEIINLIPTDVGRPISHIVSNLRYETLVEDSRSVLKKLESITTECIDKSGHWYVIRIIPYRTITNAIDGVVITFLDIHAQKQAEEQLKHLEAEKNVLALMMLMAQN